MSLPIFPNPAGFFVARQRNRQLRSRERIFRQNIHIGVRFNPIESDSGGKSGAGSGYLTDVSWMRAICLRI